MEDKTPIAGIVLFYLITLTLIIAFKGKKYDTLKKKNNKKYNDDHFGGILGGNFHISLPSIIKDSTGNTDMQKIIKEYNFLTRIFWVSVVISIPVFFWVYG